MDKVAVPVTVSFRQSPGVPVGEDPAFIDAVLARELKLEQPVVFGLAASGIPLQLEGPAVDLAVLKRRNGR